MRQNTGPVALLSRRNSGAVGCAGKITRRFIAAFFAED
jgi:hypothetical protein